MSPEEQIEFQCDVRTINFGKFLHYYVWGIKIWCLGEDGISPHHGLEQLIIKQKEFKHDYQLVRSHQ